MITYFVAGEHAPSAIEAFEGKAIVDQYGNIALKGFIVDPLTPESEVSLDVSVEPPILHLRKVMASTLFGELNQRGEFQQWSHEMNQGEHILSGDYTGPQSVLEIE